MPINTPVKLESTAKIVIPEIASSSDFSQDPYLETLSNWYAGIRSDPLFTLTKGKFKYNCGSGIIATMNYLACTSTGNNFALATKVGFIVKVSGVEKFKGKFNVFAGQVNDADQDYLAWIPSSGRWTGVLTKNTGTYLFGVEAFETGMDCDIEELFFFNADKYTYKDFLEDPVSGLVCTQSPASESKSLLPRLGFSDVIPTTGSWKQGDRVENTSWDGKFSTAIAWVCTVGGTPGTWSPVYTYDWYNSAPDPYFVSYVGSGKWLIDISAGTGTASVSNGSVVLASGTSSYSGAYNNQVKCVVAYELVTVEYVCTAASLLNAIRLGADIITDTVASVGTGSFDKTLSSLLATPNQLAAYTKAVGETLTLTKLAVRPKYPFLSKAPSSFAALPVMFEYNSQSGVIDVWYSSSSAPVTYLAGVLTFPASNALIWQRLDKPLIPGKTYRIRINMTLNPTGSVFTVITSDELWSIWNITNISVDGTTGMKELTFTIPSDGKVHNKIMIQARGATAGQKIDYVRLYLE
jgi:hypothetical protein